MSTTLLSAFYDIDFFCKTEKSLSNMLDKKAVGSPVGTSPSSNFAPGFLRRHSASNLQALSNGNAKFPGGSSSSPSSFANLKEPVPGGGGSSSPTVAVAAATTALLNKENKFRDRSFSENGERSQHLMQQLQQQQVVVTAAAASAGKGGGGNGNGSGGGGGGGGAPINSTRYKTELCRPFEESGACKYGEKCQFAHGFHELRSLTRHPKYKTELCRTFHTIGFCPYGPRCHFIHNADERRPAPANGSSGNSAPPPPPPLPPQQGCFSSAAPFYRCHQQQGGGVGVGGGGGGGGGGSCCPPPGPPASPPFSFQPLRRLSESPVFDAPPSPPDSLSDRESYLSGSLSSGSLSGSESPSLDSGRRLPIFSRLSISDD
nr:mRNA decay activator protein ZFP36L2 [Pogona vitticeps]